MKIIILSILISIIASAQAPTEPKTATSVNPENKSAVPAATPDPNLNSATAPGGESTPPVPDLKKEFVYNESEGRDPFKVYRDPTVMIPEKFSNETKHTEEKTDKILARNIKTISVPNEVVLLGIVFNKDNPVAAIKVLDGKTYYMKKNDLIGRHDGKIVEITRNTVLIEQYREFDGQKNLEKITLKFKKNEQN